MTEEYREVLKARRGQSRGDGNFPAPEEPRDLVGEDPRERTPEDLPKERDPRDAPKGNDPSGQRERDPDREPPD